LCGKYWIYGGAEFYKNVKTSNYIVTKVIVVFMYIYSSIMLINDLKIKFNCMPSGYIYLILTICMCVKSFYYFLNINKLFFIFIAVYIYVIAHIKFMNH